MKFKFIPSIKNNAMRKRERSLSLYVFMSPPCQHVTTHSPTAVSCFSSSCVQLRPRAPRVSFAAPAAAASLLTGTVMEEPIAPTALTNPSLAVSASYPSHPSKMGLWALCVGQAHY